MTDPAERIAEHEQLRERALLGRVTARILTAGVLLALLLAGWTLVLVDRTSGRLATSEQVREQLAADTDARADALEEALAAVNADRAEQGQPPITGVDVPDDTPVDVELVAQLAAALVEAPPGRRGATGQPGTAGQSGSPGPTGAAGPPGEAGTPGSDGQAGPAGVSVTSVTRTEDCRLLIGLSDGTTADVGVICGPPGPQGDPGPAGPPGAPGPPAAPPAAVTYVFDARTWTCTRTGSEADVDTAPEYACTAT